MIPTLQDVLNANQLLMALGGDDQMPKLAEAAIERSLIQQERITRALAYARTAPPASTHARNMARILDGSITVEDERAELAELPPVPAVRKPKQVRKPGPKPGSKQPKVNKDGSPRKPWGSNRAEARAEAQLAENPPTVEP